jgi:type II protein arginine methyltransferase
MLARRPGVGFDESYDVMLSGGDCRYQKLSFPAEASATVHGFAGYFEAMLYEDISISIVPQTASEGMFSWFPIYIPLRSPAYVAQGQTVQVDIWRNVSSRKVRKGGHLLSSLLKWDLKAFRWLCYRQVWYEWALTSPSVSPIHNPNGRSYWIGL